MLPFMFNNLLRALSLLCVHSVPDKIHKTTIVGFAQLLYLDFFLDKFDCHEISFCCFHFESFTVSLYFSRYLNCLYRLLFDTRQEVILPVMLPIMKLIKLSHISLSQ
jgi:hypothetical protein